MSRAISAKQGAAIGASAALCGYAAALIFVPEIREYPISEIVYRAAHTSLDWGAIGAVIGFLDHNVFDPYLIAPLRDRH